MSGDDTGKPGIGKRILDEHGNFIAVSKLPKEVQDEIKENSRKAKEEFARSQQRKVAVRDGRADEQKDAVLLKLIENQNKLIEGIMQGNVAPADISKDDLVEVPKSLTKKQSLQKEADELGLAYTESDTIKELEAMIAAENSDEL